MIAARESTVVTLAMFPYPSIMNCTKTIFFRSNLKYLLIIIIFERHGYRLSFQRQRFNEQLTTNDKVCMLKQKNKDALCALPET